MKVENWNGYDIRFIERAGEWWAVLQDIQEALDMKGYWTSGIDISNINEVTINGERHVIVDECAVYDLISRSNTIPARKFRQWSYSVMKKLRQTAGLEQFQVLRMLDKDIQDDIDHILDTLYYDPETGHVMQSVTVQGGDVEQEIYI